MELKGKVISFLGDSITQGHGVSCEEHFYWRLVGQRTGAEVRGYGIGGTRIAAEKTRLQPYDEQHFLTRVPAMDPATDVVVIFGGTNDFGTGDAPMGTMSDRTEDTFYGALHLLIGALYERFPRAQVVLMTPLHRRQEYAPLNERGDRNLAPFSAYVEAERQVAEYYSIPVLDLYRVSGIQPDVPQQRELFMPDGLHPNDAGHERIADRLTSFLQAL